MPVVVAWLVGVLESRIGSIVVSALLSLGLSYTTYKFSVAPLRTLIANDVGSLSSMAANVLGFLWVDRAITMLLSAVAAKYATQGAKAVLTRKVTS